MKKSAIYIALSIALALFCTSQIIAQGKNSDLIPVRVRNAEAAKYPDAEVKKWDTLKSVYIAKLKDKGLTRMVTFNQDAHWIKTETKVKWPWHMPAAVKAAYQKSIYHAWNRYSVIIIDTPSGQFYKILVDDSNHPEDIYHQGVLTRNRSVVFKTDGEIVDAGNPEDKDSL